MLRLSNRRAPAFGMALLLCAAMVACGDESRESSRSPAQSVTDACALLTAAEIEAATGIAPGQSVDVSQGELPMCNWPTADGSDVAFLTVLVAPSGNYESYDEAVKKWAASAASMDFPFEADDYQEVDGAGDVGAWLVDAGMLQAHTGDIMVQIMTDVADGRDKLEASRELARSALERIP
jgi:hypothetical protein